MAADRGPAIAADRGHRAQPDERLGFRRSGPRLGIRRLAPNRPDVDQGHRARSRHDIWAFGSSKASPDAIIEHYNGHVWKQQRASVLDGVEFTSILALGRANVWASGGKVSGNSFVPWLVHWNGTNWARVKPSGAALPYYPEIDGNGPMAVTRAVAKAAAQADILESGDLTPDGSGGIW
jgi:hypothetical protein